MAKKLNHLEVVASIQSRPFTHLVTVTYSDGEKLEMKRRGLDDAQIYADKMRALIGVPNMNRLNQPTFVETVSISNI